MRSLCLRDTDFGRYLYSKLGRIGIEDIYNKGNGSPFYIERASEVFSLFDYYEDDIIEELCFAADDAGYTTIMEYFNDYLTDKGRMTFPVCSSIVNPEIAISRPTENKVGWAQRRCYMVWWFIDRFCEEEREAYPWDDYVEDCIGNLYFEEY